MPQQLDRPGATAWVPRTTDLDVLRRAAVECRGCELWEPATQVVFSQGERDARLALIGEQPGDAEDRRGEPFVGPAGRVLDEALEQAGIPRSQTYVSNAVKHFRFTTRGKRRIHRTPDLAHLVACRPWLDAELEAVDPELVVLMGAVAMRAVLGSGRRVGEERGRVTSVATLDGERAVMPTVHPSSVLRTPPEDRAQAHAALVDDLRVAARFLDQHR
jgi:DNA polymerase